MVTMLERSSPAFGCSSLTVVVVGLLLAACQRMGPPAPFILHTPGASQYSQHLSSETSAIVVRKGDTLYAVARRYKVPVQAMIITNKLQPPFILRAGQALTLPPQKTHMVEKGDTLYKIARRYEVDAPALVRTNGLQAPYRVLIGQMLAIPVLSGRKTRMPLRASAPDDSRTKVTLDLVSSSPSSGSGDTFPPVTGHGNAVRIESLPTSSPPRDSTTSSRVAAAVAIPPATTPTAEPAPARLAAVNTHIPQPPKRFSQLLLWPVGGKVLNRYGSPGDGTHHDGINISAPRGTPVRAADNGIVVYVGNELKNFGNLLLIRHANDLLTAYAHHETILVRRGDTVRRGQIVGTVGTSGSVNMPQLHFEVREGVKAVDPVPYLEPGRVPTV